MSSTVAIQLVQGVLDAASTCGLNAEVLLAAIQLDPTCFAGVDERISHEQFCILWQEITRRAPHPAIGLHMAEALRPKSWDVLGYAMSSSATLAAAFERLVRYSRLRHTGAEFTLSVQDGIARLTMAIPPTTLPLNSAFCEWIGAHFVLISRRLTGLDLVPLMMGFQHSQPEDVSAYHRLFRAPLRFDQPVNEMRLNAEFLQHPLVQADLGLCKVLDRYAEELLAKLPTSESFLDRVRHILSQGLRGGDPSLAAIAQQLGYAPRTLQRKLQAAGTSYYTLLDDMRRELSVYYLKDAQLAVSEIAFLLGFSESSAFHRAFKRWTGISPGEFRLTEAIGLNKPNS
jgi:AraC-like DNA-binding protein